MRRCWKLDNSATSRPKLQTSEATEIITTLSTASQQVGICSKLRNYKQVQVSQPGEILVTSSHNTPSAQIQYWVQPAPPHASTTIQVTQLLSSRLIAVSTVKVLCQPDCYALYLQGVRLIIAGLISATLDTESKEAPLYINQVPCRVSIFCSMPTQGWP